MLKCRALLVAVVLVAIPASLSAVDGSDDCTCKCCREGGCDSRTYTYHTFTAGSRDRCTTADCSSRFSQCPDAGSHNDDGLVIASYLDCACSCCMEDRCPNLTTALFSAGSRERCSAEQCSSRFSQCPDVGSHNSNGEVFADFFDCTCKCCLDPARCEAEEFNFRRFAAGIPAACSAEQCSSRFSQCPDVGR